MKLILLSLLSFNLSAATIKIDMLGMKFVPDKVTVKVGDKILFINKSPMIHNVVSPENNIRSKIIYKGKTFEFVVKEKKTINYYCEPHRTMGMIGTINVE